MIGVFSLQKFALRLFVALVFLFAIHFSLLPNDVHAQPAAASPVPCPSPDTFAAKKTIDDLNKAAISQDVFDDKVFNINQIAGTTDSLLNLLTGCSQLHPETNEVTAGTGAVAASGKLVAMLYSNPPVSGVQYFAGVIQQFNPVQPAYAQEGIGFQALSPVQGIWKDFRNAAYVGFVIVFVVIGFMIMFRAHISPQAVATVQDSIPRIVIALILVTFSYALAGLMIDLMFLILNIAINLLGLSDKSNVVFEKSIFGVIFGSWGEIVKTVGIAVAKVINDVIDIKFLDKIIGFFGGSLAAIIAGIAILFVMFRVFIMLLMAYVTIILLTIFAPFFFLIQALPGNNGAKEWFKQIGANVGVFAAVAIMIFLAAKIGGISDLGGGESLLKGEIGKFPLLTGGLNTEAIGNLIAFGFLLMTPSAAELVKNAIGAKGPQFGGAGAAALGAGAGVLGAGLGQLRASPIGRAVSDIGEDRSRAITAGIVQRAPFGGKDVDIRKRVPR